MGVARFGVAKVTSNDQPLNAPPDRQAHPPRESEAPPKVTQKLNQMYLPPRMARREEHA